MGYKKRQVVHIENQDIWRNGVALSYTSGGRKKFSKVPVDEDRERSIRDTFHNKGREMGRELIKVEGIFNKGKGL